MTKTMCACLVSLLSKVVEIAFVFIVTVNNEFLFTVVRTFPNVKCRFARSMKPDNTLQFLFLYIILISVSCHQPTVRQMDTNYKYTNDLIHETSPYLLQHAHNPVNWHAWNDENLLEAKKLDKPLIISIGYSACHWCHVMEHESFEDDEVAKLMNDKFYCIKVDREERPDVDQVYMSAIQIITGSGGWPLNCFALPDGRPFHGGTYFRKADWLRVLSAVHEEFTVNRVKLEEFAQRLQIGIEANDEIPAKLDFETTSESYLKQIDTAIIQWSSTFDKNEGGTNRSPKFPLPNNYELLLRYAHQKNNKALLDHVHLTLKKMARGGIYDQIDGGFARYSVDGIWKVPHFEKMLYDNAQLLSLYALAYSLSKDEEYLRVIDQTSTFISNHFTDKSRAFYSAYDADSEGEEGKYYVWTKEELQAILGEDYYICEAYYNINAKGFWEHGNYILLRNEEDHQIAEKLNLSLTELQSKVRGINAKLTEIRAARIAPGLDDKSLTSWNAMTIRGLAEVYKATNDEKWLKLALDNARFLLEKQTVKDGSSIILWHSYKNGRSTIAGFLEDYAQVINAYITLYQTTFNEKWVDRALQLTDYTLTNFYDGDKGFFNFTNHESTDLIHKSVELHDNVIPASNSIMCRNLIWLYKFTGKANYDSLAADMLFRVGPRFQDYPSGYSNWMMAAMDAHDDSYELVGVGAEAIKSMQGIMGSYLPNVLMASSTKGSDGFIFLDRFKKGETLYYLCRNNSCLRPEKSIEAALANMK
jgi:uncharacterized protein